MPSDRELEFRKLQHAHEVAMYKARTERWRARTEYTTAMTMRLKVVMNFVLLIILLSLGYVTDARTVVTHWLLAWVDNPMSSTNTDQSIRLATTVIPTVEKPSPPANQ